MAYTFGQSGLQNSDGTYAPSSWDARHILTATLGKGFLKLGNGNQISISIRLAGYAIMIKIRFSHQLG